MANRMAGRPPDTRAASDQHGRQERRQHVGQQASKAGPLTWLLLLCYHDSLTIGGVGARLHRRCWGDGYRSKQGKSNMTYQPCHEDNDDPAPATRSPVPAQSPAGRPYLHAGCGWQEAVSSRRTQLRLITDLSVLTPSTKPRLPSAAHDLRNSALLALHGCSACDAVPPLPAGGLYCTAHRRRWWQATAPAPRLRL